MRNVIIAAMLTLGLSTLSYADNSALKSKIMNKLSRGTQSTTTSSAKQPVLIYGGKDIASEVTLA